LLGTDLISGTGNALANTISGNTNQNTLSGLEGNDTLTGNDGNDFLIGGVGADSMVGGRGNDLYRVDEIGDRVAEAGLATDIDVVESSITYTLPSTIENLTLIVGNTLDIDGTGNGLANTIVGSEGRNILKGLAGNDTISGGKGDDAVMGGDGDDTLKTAEGLDTLVGGNGKDVFLINSVGLGETGEALDFNALPGNDVFDISQVATGVTVANASGFIRTSASEVGTLIEIDADGGGNSFVPVLNLTVVRTDLAGLIANGAISGVSGIVVAPLAGTAAADTLAGGATSTLIQGLAGNDSLTGGTGFDTLDGGTGADTLAGGASGDTYIIDNSKDIIIDASGSDDSIISTITIDLNNAAYDGIERVALSGTGNLNATGDEFFNILIGNAGANRLDGRAGNDVMIGGVGNDIYEVDDSSDSLVEFSGEGIDQVNSLADFVLADHLDNLTLTGTGDIDGGGNALANRITGNAGANELTGDLGNDTLVGNNGFDTLDGGAGADSMAGGFGRDEYFVDDIGDRIAEVNEVGPTDEVVSTINYTLGANLEQLSLSGSADLKGTGNSLNNGVFGGLGNDTLSGLAGDDFLFGNSGNDLLLGGDGADTLRMTDGSDTLVGGAGNDVFQLFFEFDLDGPEVIADFNATSNGDRIDFADVLIGFDPASSNINDYLQCVTVSDGTKIRVDIDGGGDSFVDFVTLTGVTTDLTGLLNNGSLMIGT
ncbi:MAG TPA: calcium-binding protein, partial [Verrucomicrobiae bacterium]|nr:calcium-binding protein [Verrucomicrobiae bacterium]